MMVEKKIEALLRDYRPEHSGFQMQNFIVGGGHPWGQYKQALRELSARRKGWEESNAQIASLKAEIKSKRNWKWWTRRRDTSALERRLSELRNARKSKAREYFTFYRIARDLKRELGEITPQRRRELEADMWLDKARRMAAIDLLSIGGLQRSTVEFISSFPREMRREVIKDLRPENRQILLSIID
jgi:hypothetical protein